jgi:hypothetical protein
VGKPRIFQTENGVAWRLRTGREVKRNMDVGREEEVRVMFSKAKLQSRLTRTRSRRGRMGVMLV